MSSKLLYDKETASRSTATWRFNPFDISIVGVDEEITDENRHYFCRRALRPPSESMIKSLMTYGLREPIKTKKQPSGKARLVVGRRRLLALREAFRRAEANGDEAAMAVLSSVRALESTAETPADIIREIIIENEHREEDSPLGRIDKIMEARTKNLEFDEIADLFDCSVEHAKNMVLLGRLLIPEAKEKLETGELPQEAAIEMVRSMTEEEQKEKLPEILAAPKGEKKQAARRSAGKDTGTLKAPKLRIVKKVIALIPPNLAEVIEWARGQRELEDVSDTSFQNTVRDVLLGG